MSPIDCATEKRLVLSELPEFDPCPSLWGRIRTANVRRVRLRRVRRVGALGVVFAGVVATWLFGSSRWLAESIDSLDSAEWQARSQELQDQWNLRSDLDLDPRTQARLRLLDNDLQAAYDRGASEPELAPLWLLRSRLLQSLVDGESGRSRRLTRI